jgi:hypothetical protein
VGIGHSNTLCGWVGTQAAIRRPDVLKENPGIAFGAVGKLMGEEWRAMPEHQKAPYVAKAEAAKAQYDIDKANYGEPQREAWRVDAALCPALPCARRAHRCCVAVQSLTQASASSRRRR